MKINSRNDKNNCRVGYEMTEPHKSAGSDLRNDKTQNPISRSLILLCLSLPCRCGVSGGPGLPQSLGHSVLDQLHHVLHHQAHGGPAAPWGVQPRGRDHHGWGRPPPRAGPGWMPKVGVTSLLQILILAQRQATLLYFSQPILLNPTEVDWISPFGRQMLTCFIIGNFHCILLL